VCIDDDSDSDMFPVELFNTKNPKGFPIHILKLKKNAALMLLQNLISWAGLCNGTQLQLIDFSTKLLCCKILYGNNTRNMYLIPRTLLQSSEFSSVPFTQFRFPVALAFAMTINKS
jgi:PIF1-like helicase